MVNDPVFKVITEIDIHLNKLNSGWNPFKRSAKKKIESLINLKDILLVQIEGTIGEVLDDWALDNGELLSQHRNIFRSEKREVETETQVFFNQLKTKYAGMSMKLEGEIPRHRKERKYTPFVDYISARTNPWERLMTFFFRNSNLSAEKISFANKIVEEIKDFTGTYNQLNALLNQEKLEHTNLSRKYGKNHYNLLEERPEQYISTTERGYPPRGFNRPIEPARSSNRTIVIKDVRPGEDHNRSELADTFHSALKVCQ